MFEQLRTKAARWLAPHATVTRLAPTRTTRPMDMARMYAAAKQSRLTVGWGQNTTSEDTESAESLTTMRNRSRELMRDSAYAKRAKVIVQNNVVGPGIGLQAKVGTTRQGLHSRINDDIETQYKRWSKASSCHTGGELHFADFERALMGQAFEAGESFVRLHRQPFGDSNIPLALELVEAERMADSYMPGSTNPTHTVRLGVEMDQFHRPVAYWIRTLHPGELRLTAERMSKIERVPAEDIIHLRIIDRWPQTRGVPWLHAAMRRLNDMDGLSEAEIVGSRAAACYMGFITMPADPDGQGYGETQPDGSTQSELEPAMIERLNPGEEFTFAAPNRPNTQLDPFMRYMLREVAAGVGCSYESISRDYSRSNYSSSRLALLDDRDLWRMLQLWFIRSFRERLHREWLRMAIMSRAITSIPIEGYAAHPALYEAARFKPRGWSWVDPTKEVQAYKEAIRCGFTTVSAVIAMTGDGRDLDDVLEERRYELDLMKEMDLSFDTDPGVDAKGAPVAATVPVTPDDEESTTDADAEDDPTDDGEDASVRTAESVLRSTARRSD